MRNMLMPWPWKGYVANSAVTSLQQETFTRGEYFQVGILIIIALALRCYVAALDPFLHTWDEQYHALVARNMMTHRFTPMLRRIQLLPYDYREWVANTVWLHKQPLFMWQMALSMKVFGVSLFALRLPSILMGSLMVPMIYHICRLMRCDHWTALMAAAMHCCSYYHLELISGNVGMDHNDIAFSFYILASFWAYANYRKGRKLSWVIAIGAFAGCAILCKWLTGLLIYAGWIAALCLTRPESRRRGAIHLLLSLIATFIIIMPWQLYILSRFPKEAGYEYAYNAQHLWKAVEGHSGNWDYYFRFFPRYFGDTICWLIPAGVLMMLMNRRLNRSLSIAIVSVALSAILFFSFMAQTKVYAYLMPVLPLGISLFLTVPAVS